MVILPTFPGEPAYTYSTRLADVTFRFTFRWVERTGSWYFDVADAQSVALVSGVRVAVGQPLLARYKSGVPGLPSGWLWAFSMTDDPSDPGFGDLGERVQIAHYSREEVLAFLESGAAPEVIVEAVV